MINPVPETILLFICLQGSTGFLDIHNEHVGIQPKRDEGAEIHDVAKVDDSFFD